MEEEAYYDINQTLLRDREEKGKNLNRISLKIKLFFILL